MAEFTNANLQVVQPNQPVVYNETPDTCNNGCITHREGAGVIRLLSLIHILYTTFVNCSSRRTEPTASRTRWMSTWLPTGSPRRSTKSWPGCLPRK